LNLWAFVHGLCTDKTVAEVMQFVREKSLVTSCSEEARNSNVIALSVLLVCSASNAQQPAPNITPIMEAPITGQPDKVFALYSLERPPESTMPLHSHPGDE
jgi:hypothetical protein